MPLVNPLKAYIGEGRIYTVTAAPASLTRMAMASAPLPDGGTFLGLTSGPATVEYKPTFTAVEIEQAYGEVAPRVTKEAVMLRFKTGTPKLKADSDGGAALALSLSNATIQDVTGPTATVAYIGGRAFGPSQVVALVSPIKNPTDGSTQYWEWVMIYSSIATNGSTIVYKRGESRLVEIDLTGYPDPDRTENDQLFQLGQQHA